MEYSKEIYKLGLAFSKGIRDGFMRIVKETETNNSRKHKGLPLKRKHYKKDDRNQIRRRFQRIQRIKSLRIKEEL